MKEIWIHGDQSTNLKFPQADNKLFLFLEVVRLSVHE